MKKTENINDPDFTLFQQYITWKQKGSPKISAKKQQEITEGYNRYFEKYIPLPTTYKKPGRKRLYNEPSISIRVPESLVPEIKELIKIHQSKNL